MARSQDEVNRAAFASDESVRLYTGYSSYTDAGERAAFEWVREHGTVAALLDIGVGAGRTVELAAPLCDDYVAIDYLPEMVDACRARYPEIRVELGDARALSGLPRDHFSVVVFSLNGIDMLNHADRQRALVAINSVLKPGGLFVFSTINRDGPIARRRPWRPRSRHELVAMPASTVRYLRTRALAVRTDAYSCEPMSGHGYRIVAHMTRLPELCRELAQAGFDEPEAIFSGADGSPVDVGEVDTRSPFWHVVVRRSSEAPPTP